jgi:hypothetical protein
MARRRDPNTPHEDHPDLTPEDLADEAWVLSLLHEVSQEVHAPRRLRLRIEAEARSRRRPVRGMALGAGPGLRGASVLRAVLAGAGGAVLLAVALMLPGGAAPSLSQAAALSGRGAISPAPAPDPEDPAVKLSESVDDVYFPNWSSTLGWRPTGQRRDLLNDHPAVTVYYAASERRLAYTIVSGPALAQPAATVTVTGGLTLRTLRLHGRLIVTWRRDGRTCVLTGTKVSAAQLRQLALTDPPPDSD